MDPVLAVAGGYVIVAAVAVNPDAGPPHRVLAVGNGARVQADFVVLVATDHDVGAAARDDVVAPVGRAAVVERIARSVWIVRSAVRVVTVQVVRAWAADDEIVVGAATQAVAAPRRVEDDVDPGVAVQDVDATRPVDGVVVGTTTQAVGVVAARYVIVAGATAHKGAAGGDDHVVVAAIHDNSRELRAVYEHVIVAITGFDRDVLFERYLVAPHDIKHHRSCSGRDVPDEVEVLGGVILVIVVVDRDYNRCRRRGSGAEVVAHEHLDRIGLAL